LSILIYKPTLSKCQNGKNCEEDEPVYAVFPVVNFDVSDLQGLFIPFTIADIPLIGMVAFEDSDAWKDGKKIIIATCSEKCAKLTKKLLKNQEINFQKISQEFTENIINVSDK